MVRYKGLEPFRKVWKTLMLTIKHQYRIKTLQQDQYRTSRCACYSSIKTLAYFGSPSYWVRPWVESMVGPTRLERAYPWLKVTCKACFATTPYRSPNYFVTSSISPFYGEWWDMMVSHHPSPKATILQTAPLLLRYNIPWNLCVASYHRIFIDPI